MKHLDAIKEYQRPLRTVLWVILITFAFINCLTGSIPCKENPMVQYIIMGMFADMGVYTAARSYEKIKQMYKDKRRSKDDARDEYLEEPE